MHEQLEARVCIWVYGHLFFLLVTNNHSPPAVNHYKNKMCLHRIISLFQNSAFVRFEYKSAVQFVFDQVSKCINCLTWVTDQPVSDQNGVYMHLGKYCLYFTSSLRSLTSVALETVPRCGMIDDCSFWSFEVRSWALPIYILLQEIDDVISLVLVGSVSSSSTLQILNSGVVAEQSWDVHYPQSQNTKLSRHYIDPSSDPINETYNTYSLFLYFNRVQTMG